MAILTKEKQKQLDEEIKNAQNLSRNERRKLERKLNKKYNQKNIRIKSGKSFHKSEGLTRKQKRLLMKDKNILKTMLEIIHKYFPELTSLFNKLTDKRHKGYITYSMRAIIMTRLFALICGITSMNDMTNKFNTEESIKNLSSICGQKLDEVPNWQTIQDVFENLKIEEIEDIRNYLVKAIVRSKMFDKYRYNGYFQLLVDATGISSHDYNLNGNCISKTSKKDGTTKYYKYVLEAKLVFGNIVMSLDTEWIENNEINNEKQKQDCEINAFKRMAPRIKKRYPKLKFIITGDALYASTPMINLCNEYDWLYIFNLKKDRLKNVWQSFVGNLQCENETNIPNYFLSTNIDFNNNMLNCLRYMETINNKTTVFNYVTNLNINDNNIEEIVCLGRRRWKIENEGFNEQKNGVYAISHLSSRNNNAIKVHYLLIQFAHLFRQLLEWGSLIIKDLKMTKKEISFLITHLLISSTLIISNLELNFQLRFDD